MSRLVLNVGITVSDTSGDAPRSTKGWFNEPVRIEADHVIRRAKPRMTDDKPDQQLRPRPPTPANFAD